MFWIAFTSLSRSHSCQAHSTGWVTTESKPSSEEGEPFRSSRTTHHDGHEGSMLREGPAMQVYTCLMSNYDEVKELSVFLPSQPLWKHLKRSGTQLYPLLSLCWDDVVVVSKSSQTQFPMGTIVWPRILVFRSVFSFSQVLLSYLRLSYFAASEASFFLTPNPMAFERPLPR